MREKPLQKPSASDSSASRGVLRATSDYQDYQSVMKHAFKTPISESFRAKRHSHAVGHVAANRRNTHGIALMGEYLPE